MKKGFEIFSSFIWGILLGATIWWASPFLSGEIEPWDGPIMTYCLCLFVAGVLAAFPNPPRFWFSTLGIYLGQFLYMFLFLPGGPLWILGMFFGISFLLNSLLGGVLVYVFWTIRRKPENE